MSIERYDYDRRTGRNKQPFRIMLDPKDVSEIRKAIDDDSSLMDNLMPVVTMMPLKRFARAVDNHTAANGTPPELIWPTETGDRLVKRKRLL